MKKKQEFTDLLLLAISENSLYSVKEVKFEKPLEDIGIDSLDVPIIILDFEKKIKFEFDWMELSKVVSPKTTISEAIEYLYNIYVKDFENG